LKRAVWSFWSKPYAAFHRRAWLSPKHHLLSWILSVGEAQVHFPETVLVTDDLGAELLVEKLGLRFRIVSRELNELEDEDPCWWALGKLHAYRYQTEPFVHIDNDVFLWRALPARLTSLPVFAQNPERFRYGYGAYRPDLWDQTVGPEGWLPSEWKWYTRRLGSVAVCCGIVGGCNTGFVRHYADAAIRMIQCNREKLASLKATEKLGSNILVEQYLLAACIEYHLRQSESSFGPVQAGYLFDSEEDAARDAEAYGYTHLIAGAKRNPELCVRLEQRVRSDYPGEYRMAARNGLLD
jgi:hypothetical protein